MKYTKAKKLLNKSKSLYSKIFEINDKKFELFSYRYVDYELYKKYPLAKELRGLVFDLETKKPVYSLHKFFNLNEIEETTNTINEDTEIEVYEKVDGSLLQAFIIDDKLFVKTKNSFENDITKQCKKFINKNENYLKFLNYCKEKELFPQFEYIGPNNQIVIYYPEEKLVLLHSRNKNGKYLSYNELKEITNEFNISLVKKHDLTFKDILNKVQTEENIEGWVIRNLKPTNPLDEFIKVKTLWYLKRHKIINKISAKTIWEKVLNDDMDDVLSFINTLKLDNNLSNFNLENNINRIKYFYEIFSNIFNTYYFEKEKMLKEWNEINDRKTFAKKWKHNIFFAPFMAELKGKEPKKWFLEYGTNDKKINQFVKRFKNEYSR